MNTVHADTSTKSEKIHQQNNKLNVKENCAVQINTEIPLRL